MTPPSPTLAATDELVITRVFDAPRELVFQVWTDPRHITAWWGPQHFTSPTAQVDLRVGGRYLFCMRSPEGQDYWSTGVYKEIVAPERLVYTDSFADANGNAVPASHYGMGDDWPPALEITVTFEALEPRKTRLTVFQTGVPAGQMRELSIAGMNQSLDKVAAYLATL
jgi:uncharacterized protein YndB with AHSA1/START domain